MSIYFTKNFQRAFGTFPLTGDALRHALELALDAGYRAIDTAQLYKNEQDVGATLETSGIPADDLLLTTKVMHTHFTESQFLDSVKRSLDHLKRDRVDVLLLHWPPADGDVQPSLALLREAQLLGLTQHIGVSNYTAAMMRTAKALLDVPLVVNQVEFHPLLNQSVLLAAAQETGIPLSSYCSVARGLVFQEQLLRDIAQKTGKTVAQVTLRWILQQGVSVTTMSTSAANLRNNYAIDDFTLSAEDMATIDTLTHSCVRIVDSKKVPWAPVWDTPERA